MIDDLKRNSFKHSMLGDFLVGFVRAKASFSWSKKAGFAKICWDFWIILDLIIKQLWSRSYYLNLILLTAASSNFNVNQWCQWDMSNVIRVSFVNWMKGGDQLWSTSFVYVVCRVIKGSYRLSGKGTLQVLIQLRRPHAVNLLLNIAEFVFHRGLNLA